MTEEKTVLLTTKYPTLYRDNFCFECGDGWFKLIDQLSHLITSYDEEVIALQVKEKFAGLRFYVQLSDNYVDGLITMAEEMSYGICEKCGSNENVTINKTGWRVAWCEKCRDDKTESERNNCSLDKD